MRTLSPSGHFYVHAKKLMCCSVKQLKQWVIEISPSLNMLAVLSSLGRWLLKIWLSVTNKVVFNNKELLTLGMWLKLSH